MKIYHFNYASNQGGAARAAKRIHQALLNSDVESSMYVDFLDIAGEGIVGPVGPYRKGINLIRKKIGSLLSKSYSKDNASKHSFAILSSNWVKFINNSDADIIHLHWINNEMLSISDIRKIKKPIVWTFHDMWPFCGTEHLAQDDRWITGYHNSSQRNYEKFFDLSYWSFKRKLNNWKNPIQIVTPSSWLSNCVKKSFLMNSWPVETIPNCLDTSVWSPLDKNTARDILGLSKETPIILFGSYGSNTSYNKGFDLLLKSIQILQNNKVNLSISIFGNSYNEKQLKFDFPINYFGFLHDDISLKVLYSAADVIVIPSRQESFGQVASEAQACGTPVVAFDTSGLRDVVEHKKTGYLAKKFDVSDFAEGIKWVCMPENQQFLSKNSRSRAQTFFSNENVAGQYKKLYSKIIESKL